MKFCDLVSLLLEVLWGSTVTTLLVLRECFFWLVPRRQKSVKDEIIVVTGAGHGLGRRVAINLSKLGAIVVCWDKNADTNINTMYDIKHAGGRAAAYTCDVRDRVAVMATAARVATEVGPVTMLINNAGIYPVKAVVEWSPDELKELFDTNIMAHFWTLQAFLPSMIEQNYGHIVAMSSAASIAPVANEVPYSVTKSAVTGLMDGMIQELGLNPNSKVRVTTIHPYYTAVRDDIPVRFDLRFERMSPDFVAAEIVKGIRQNREAISVPRFMWFWICFMRCLPQASRKRWRKVFYTYVWPIPEDAATTNGDSVVNIENKTLYPEIVRTALQTPAENLEGAVNGNGNHKTGSKLIQEADEILSNDTSLSYTESDFEKALPDHPKTSDSQQTSTPKTNNNVPVSVLKTTEVKSGAFVDESSLANGTEAPEAVTCSVPETTDQMMTKMQSEVTPI